MSRAASGQTSDAHRTEAGCAIHPGSPVRRYRTHGPQGPGVYPQCVPQNGDVAHLLAWPVAAGLVNRAALVALTTTEVDVLNDAASGLTMVESATHRAKSVETVKTQRKKLLLKLNARNMTQAVAIAVHEGLVPGPPGLS